MIDLQPDSLSENDALQTKNRVGDFFCKNGDRVGNFEKPPVFKPEKIESTAMMYVGVSLYHKGGRILVAAIASGTISDMTGGSFSNGAMTGAMIQILNNEVQLAKERKDGDILNLNEGELTPGDIKIKKVGATLSKPGMSPQRLAKLKNSVDGIVALSGKVPSRIPKVGEYYEKMGELLSKGIYETLLPTGMTTAYADLQIQFYEGQGSALGGLIKWENWSEVYTIHNMAPVPAHSGILDGYTFESGSEALSGANSFINRSLINLLNYNKYRND